MRRNVNSRTFVNMFIFFFAIIIVIEACIFSFFIIRATAASDQDEKDKIEETVAVLQDYVDDLIRNERLLAAYQNKLPLITKIASGSSVFEADLDPYYVKQLVPYMSAFNPSAENIAAQRFIYFTVPDQVLCNDGMLGLSGFLYSFSFSNRANYIFSQDSAGNYEPSGIALTPELLRPYLTNDFPGGLHVFDENRKYSLVIVSFPLQSRKVPSAYLCTVFNANEIERRLEAMMPPEFVRAEVLVKGTGQVMLDMGKGSKEDATMIVSSPEISPVGWQMKFYIDEGLILKRSETILQTTVTSFIAVILSAGVAYMVARHFYRPLGNILKLMPNGASTKDAYQSIANNFTKISETLKNEKKENILRKLLSEAVSADDPGLQLISIKDDMWVQTFSFYPKEEHQGNDAVIATLDQMLALHPDWVGELLMNKGHSLILVIGTKDKKELFDAFNRIDQLPEEKDYYVFSGGVCRGYSGIGESFRMIMEQEFYRSLAQVPLFYLPIDFEKQLISALEDGQERLSLNLLDQIEDENMNRFMNGEIARVDVLQLGTRMMTDFVQVVEKKNLDSDLLQPFETLNFASIENMFALFREVAHAISVQMNDRSLSVNRDGMRIVQYINEHYSDTALSIVTLQEEFNLSATTINKNIKLATGQTFLPYLTNVRMEKAKELLRDHRNKISDVRLMVGYEQENSFRRAFRKYTGYNPQDYIASLHQEDA